MDDEEKLANIYSSLEDFAPEAAAEAYGNSYRAIIDGEDPKKIMGSDSEVLFIHNVKYKPKRSHLIAMLKYYERQEEYERCAAIYKYMQCL